MLYRWEQSGVVLYRSPQLDALGVPHGFGTKQGDELAMAGALELIGREWIRVHQVHGRAVHLPGHALSEQPCDADAVVLRDADQVTRMLTADCVPILLAATDGRAVAAVHAGWRGLLSGVIEQAVDVLGARFVAAIGPCISARWFEVGDEVAERFDSRFVRYDWGDKSHVDLRAAAHAQLDDLGAQAIDTTDRCTYAHEAEFFSHRRDVTHRQFASTGRMSSVIGRSR